MPNIEKRRKAECQASGCPYYAQRCIVFFGNDCTRLGGKKIPVMWSLKEIKSRQRFNISTTFKPHFKNNLTEEIWL